MEPVFTLKQMKERYGPFYEKGPLLSLDEKKVPPSLWPLMPYASFWGLTDDWAREALALNAPPDVQRNLKAIVAAFDDSLDEWLAGSEATNPNPSREYLAFSAMRMAADFM